MEKLLLQRSGKQELGTLGRFSCAAVAGTVSALIATPTELVIIQQQVRMMPVWTFPVMHEVLQPQLHTCKPDGRRAACVQAPDHTQWQASNDPDIKQLCARYTGLSARKLVADSVFAPAEEMHALVTRSEALLKDLPCVLVLQRLGKRSQHLVL
jgi:hypothetical protein